MTRKYWTREELMTEVESIFNVMEHNLQVAIQHIPEEVRAEVGKGIFNALASRFTLVDDEPKEEKLKSDIILLN